MPSRHRSRETRRPGATEPVEPPVATRPCPPGEVVVVDNPDAAHELAARLLTPDRRWPVAVVSTAADTDAPYVDVATLKADVGDLAEVALVRTGDPSWAFSAQMPPQTQVYGGASRVYPVDHDWVGQPRRSRLRFAYSVGDGERVRQDLVHDVLGAALRAGLIGSTELSPSASVVEGTVSGVLGQRAIVDLDGGGQATVAEELTGAGVPLDQVLAKGLRVQGVLDPTTRLLDVAAHLPDAGASRSLVEAAYAPGDVVLVRVRSVEPDVVTVELTPQHSCVVRRERVTTNDLDHLDSLFEPGEVVHARVVAASGELAVRLDDVDETEDVPVPAIALLPGGPPWLLPPAPAAPGATDLIDATGTTTGEPSSAPEAWSASGSEPGVAAPVLPVAPVAPVRPVAPEPSPVVRSTPPRPTPALLSHGTTHRPPSPQPFRSPRQQEPPAEAAPPVAPAAKGKALQDAQLALAAALTRADAAEREAASSSQLARQLKAENEHLLTEVHDLNERVARLENSLSEQKRKYRNADRRRQQAEGRLPEPDADGPWFTDPLEQLRHEVHTAWVRGVPAAQKASLPLRGYTVGPRFIGSLALGGISRRKVVDTVVHVVTGRAADVNGLQLHALRTDEGGGSPQVVRDDGATCWRVSLQVNTPSARRLHFWRLPDGTYELSRVVLHDDVEP